MHIFQSHLLSFYANDIVIHCRSYYYIYSISGNFKFFFYSNIKNKNGEFFFPEDVSPMKQFLKDKSRINKYCKYFVIKVM